MQKDATRRVGGKRGNIAERLTVGDHMADRPMTRLALSAVYSRVVSSSSHRRVSFSD
jgi:hypothetical protein